MKSIDRYKFCKKHKWANWIDDNIIYYIYDTPRYYIQNIRSWFRNNWNIYHWKTVKCAILSYPWDGGFITELEEAKINEAYHFFKNNQTLNDEEYHIIMRSLGWAKNLIKYVNDNGSSMFTLTGEVETIPKENGLTEIRQGTLKKIYTGPRVNKRNASRFLNNAQLNSEYFMNECLEDIYVIKAKALYYKIRNEYTDRWWD